MVTIPTLYLSAGGGSPDYFVFRESQNFVFLIFFICDFHKAIQLFERPSACLEVDICIYYPLGTASL